MLEYKSIKLEDHVYDELSKRMRPTESMSQAIDRLLNDIDGLRYRVETMERSFANIQLIIEAVGGIRESKSAQV